MSLDFFLKGIVLGFSITAAPVGRQAFFAFVKRSNLVDAQVSSLDLVPLPQMRSMRLWQLWPYHRFQFSSCRTILAPFNRRSFFAVSWLENIRR